MNTNPNALAHLPDCVRPGDALGEACSLQIVSDTLNSTLLNFFHSTIALPWGVVKVFCGHEPMVLNYKIVKCVKCSFMVILSHIQGEQWLTQSLGKLTRPSKSASETDPASWDPAPDELREGIDYINRFEVLGSSLYIDRNPRLRGIQSVHVQTMQRTSYACRKSFGPNFVWEDSAKYNTVNSDTMGRILFVNNKCGFATDYLHYHSLLQFRTFVATRAVKDVYQEVFGISHSDKSERDIIIGNKISESSLRAKVHVKCDNVLRQPRADKRVKPYGHGWFMLVHPKNLRILWARAMEAPDRNDILETALRKILPKYPMADGVVVDRACSFLPCKKPYHCGSKKGAAKNSAAKKAFHKKGAAKKPAAKKAFHKKVAQKPSACKKLILQR
ncbi:hypothetical protein AK812_SmicGene39147 [Symbiodinium microadriaticum]|uniref:Uncharacterized protein n=1 Tax=Symbiodinium microadriaticum TaxID=2951 RepID=A0A1Q9CBZ4_SYMMI|nr:hypothetical protein AK812_SmicGene39147 [Symbiodinium microadriaticum]